MDEFVVTSGDTSEVFDTTEEAFDQVSIFVGILIEMPLDGAILFWRDDGLNLTGRQRLDKDIRA